MTPTLSIIVATLGRATLGRALASIRSQDLQGGDEVIVCGDGRRPEAEQMFRESGLPGRYLDGPVSSHRPAGGGEQRTFATGHAAGTHLLYLDDDDAYNPGALACVREAVRTAPGRLLLFRVHLPWAGRPLVWHTEGRLEVGNVSTCGTVVPNDPARLKPWGRARACDWEFVRDTAPLLGEPVWRPEVLVTARPFGPNRL